jgi:hypothetical protein
MDSIERFESVDIEGDRSIFLEFGRKWPKYVVAWSVRERAGDSDFPVEAGSIDLLPTSEREGEEIWDELRQQALERAGQSVKASKWKEAKKPKRRLVDRLLGRN